ncbi:dienelactone hydrolase family protein [Kitasatospora sp. NPDC088346]|uniref:dienelactone hydrolase family protein n=1 Tax=Kitasatospora sp. NPDC088346 TaxID=3364073 RepID=UPI00382A707F
MCFDPDSAPPVEHGPGAVAEAEVIALRSADGTEFAAFRAAGETPSGVGVVVLPDVRGLYGFYRELGLRFAENGHTALVVDYYGRTAGVGERAEDFPYQEHMRRLTPRQLHEDLTAAIAHLRSPEGGNCRAVVTIGFCIGGRLAVLASIRDRELAGTIGYYCWPAPGPDGAPGPTGRAADLGAPVLALMAGDDPGIPAQHVKEFEEALAAAGVDHEVVTYEGAPHSFFDVKQKEFTADSVDSWRRVLAFVDRVAGPVG